MVRRSRVSRVETHGGTSSGRAGSIVLLSKAGREARGHLGGTSSSSCTEVHSNECRWLRSVIRPSGTGNIPRENDAGEFQVLIDAACG